MSSVREPAFNQQLFRAVPVSAHRILHVGCGAGSLGVALKAAIPTRQVLGVDIDAAAIERARSRLNGVWKLDIEQQDIPSETGSLDCIVYEDVLERLHDSEAVLRRHRKLLRSGGCIVLSIANVQHHTLLKLLLTGDWQYRMQPRVFTYSTAMKLLLDAGFAPQIVDRLKAPGDPQFHATFEPLLKHLGLHLGRTRSYLDTSQYIVRGDPLAEPALTAVEPLTFAACVSDVPNAEANLKSSPDLQPGTPHEILPFRGADSAADALNDALTRACNRIVVCLHQDVYLPRGWVQRFLSAWRQAEMMHGRIGVAGVYGVRLRQGNQERAGRVVDRDCWRSEPLPLPALVDTLDELLLAVPRDSGLRFDESLGWHLYGADIALTAQLRGLAAVALDAPCLHNSRSVDLPPTFFDSGRVFARKWASRLPLLTPCYLFTEPGSGGKR